MSLKIDFGLVPGSGKLLFFEQKTTNWRNYKLASCFLDQQIIKYRHGSHGFHNRNGAG